MSRLPLARSVCFAISAFLLPGLLVLPVHVYSQAATQPQAPDPKQQTVIAPVKTEVTVTGTRTPIELESSPVSQAIVSRQEIENRDVRLIDKALEQTPGVISLRARGASDNDFGLGLRGFAGRGGQVRTLILLDDQPINNSFNGSINWAIFSPADLQRIEVARGPFSSLYGGNAMGGVINLISRRPEGRHGDFFYQYGSRATDNFSAHVSDRYFDKLGLTLGYSRYKTGGYSPQEVFGSVSTSAAAATPVTTCATVRWTQTTGLTITCRDRNFHTGRTTLAARSADQLRFQVFIEGAITRSSSSHTRECVQRRQKLLRKWESPA